MAAAETGDSPRLISFLLLLIPFCVLSPTLAIEKRIDENDGRPYTKKDFVEYYGGTFEWDMSKPYSPPGGTQDSLQSGALEAESIKAEDFDLHPDDVPEKTIWAYWEDGEANMPDFYKICVESWKALNRGWSIRVLAKTDISLYLSRNELPPGFNTMPPHGASDHIRLGLLAKYGGVWLDVNILLRVPLDTLIWKHLEDGDAEFVGAYNPVYGSAHFNMRDFVESWFLATKRHNPFVYRWRDLLLRLFYDRTASGFQAGLLKDDLYQGIDLSNFLREGVDFREYLAIHVMLRRILETDAVLRSMWKNKWLLYSTEDTGLKWQKINGDWGLPCVEALFKFEDSKWKLIRDTPFMKFTTPSNVLLQKLPRNSFFEPGTIIQRILNDIGIVR